MEQDKTSELVAASGRKAARLFSKDLSSPDLARSVLKCGSSSYRPYSFRAHQEERAGKAGPHIYSLPT